MDVLQHALVAVELVGALFARMTPSFADGSAAELLGADDSLQLALAHVVADARETRPGTVICPQINGKFHSQRYFLIQSRYN